MKIRITEQQRRELLTMDIITEGFSGLKDGKIRYTTRGGKNIRYSVYNVDSVDKDPEDGYFLYVRQFDTQRREIPPEMRLNVPEAPTAGRYYELSALRGIKVVKGFMSDQNYNELTRQMDVAKHVIPLRVQNKEGETKILKFVSEWDR